MPKYRKSRLYKLSCKDEDLDDQFFEDEENDHTVSAHAFKCHRPQIHKVLRIYEILDNIFAFLAEDKDHRRTLFALALTCKCFSEPALDALWRNMSSILPIFKVFSSFSRNPMSFSTGARTYVLTGGITEAEWDCYDAYASRIRTLSLVGVPHVAHSVYLTLSLLRTPTPLLPALQSLSIQREDILPALALISPALEHLSLTELTCSDPVPSILAILSRKSPGLRQLTIAGYISWAHLQSLDQLRNLRFLSIQTPSTPHNFNFVRRLLLLPCLRSLHISVQGGVLIKAESLISNTSQLSNLTIMGPYLSLGTLLDMVICPSITNLKSLALVVQYDGLLPPPKSLRSFWKHIYPYMNSLLSLSFRLLQAPGNFEPHVEPCFAMDIMEPLLVFRQLQNLDLRFSHMQPFLYDFQVEVLANAWPSIETLSLPNCSNPTTTADGLANFARSCPCLTKLQVDVNLLKVWKPTLPVRTHGLRELTFGRFSVWADTLDTARNLDRLFPALLVVSHDSNVQAHASEGTQYITKALSVFQSIREDERLRYQTAS